MGEGEDAGAPKRITGLGNSLKKSASMLNGLLIAKEIWHQHRHT